MRVIAVYKPRSEHARGVETFASELKRIFNHDIELMDAESVEGIQFCSLYDVVQYPTVLALSPEGSPVQSWKGGVPLLNEITYFFDS